MFYFIEIINMLKFEEMEDLQSSKRSCMHHLFYCFVDVDVDMMFRIVCIKIA